MPTSKKRSSRTPKFERRTLEKLKIEDEPAFRDLPLYSDLKAVVTRAKIPFRVLAPPSKRSALFGERSDHALLLNLTFWGATEGGDVLSTPVIPADVVAHVAWHHLAARALESPSGHLSADALFLGESVASAFDLFLVGHLLRKNRASSFLETQVPAMAESAAAAGVPAERFEALLSAFARDPESAFSDLRELLFDGARALFACKTAEDAIVVLSDLDEHPLAAILHRYELSNWVLYARAYSRTASDAASQRTDRALRKAALDRESSPLAWLVDHWLKGFTLADRKAAAR